MSVHRDGQSGFSRPSNQRSPTAVTEQLSLLLVRLVATEFMSVFVAAYMIGMI
jgi:hypothetical protein